MASHEAYLRSALSKYSYPEPTKREVLTVLGNFTDLRPTIQKYVFNDGIGKDLLCLEGTIAVMYKGRSYNIPICMWLMDTHPCNPPLVYVKPTATMQIKPGRHVDSTGRIYLPYLNEWQHLKSDIIGVIEVLKIVFGEESPVFSKAASTRSQPTYPIHGAVNPPYPLPGVSNMDGSQLIDTKTKCTRPFEESQAPIERKSAQQSEGGSEDDAANDFNMSVSSPEAVVSDMNFDSHGNKQGFCRVVDQRQPSTSSSSAGSQSSKSISYPASSVSIVEALYNSVISQSQPKPTVKPMANKDAMQKHKGNPEQELLPQATTALQSISQRKIDDELDAFGKYVACELRQIMSNKKLKRAKRDICAIVAKAQDSDEEDHF